MNKKIIFSKNNVFILILLIICLLYILRIEFIVNSQMSEFNSEIQALLFQLENLNNEIKELVYSLDEKNKILSEKTENIEELKKKLKMLNNELDKVNNDYNSTKSDIDKIASKNSKPSFLSRIADVVIGSILWVYFMRKIFKKKF